LTRAVNAGRKCKRCPGACRLIDSALERTRLVVRTAGADPELAGVDSESADGQGTSRCPSRRCGNPHCRGGECYEMTPLHAHAQFSCASPMRMRLKIRAILSFLYLRASEKMPLALTSTEGCALARRIGRPWARRCGERQKNAPRFLGAPTGPYKAEQYCQPSVRAAGIAARRMASLTSARSSSENRGRPSLRMGKRVTWGTCTKHTSRGDPPDAASAARQQR